jgi:hypothetical protein
MKMKVRYNINKAAKLKEELVCPSCNSTFIKTHYAQAFCKTKNGTKCKDKYWNTVTPEKRNNTTRISPANAAYYADNLGADNYARKRGFPDHEAMEDAYDMEDGSWDSHGGIELAICNICNLRADFCRCGEDGGLM